MRSALTLRERLERVYQSFFAYLTRDRSFLARIEFWVYLPGDELPVQEEIMNRMMVDNPYSIRGVSPIGAAEGLLFSDVRTHIALVLKANNPQIFRGGNFPDSMVIPAEQLAMIRESHSLVKVSYISDQPLSGLTHVTFVTHAVAAIAHLGASPLIYDQVREKLWPISEFQDALRKNPKGDSSDLHLGTLWEVVGSGSRIETRGLQKIGIADLRSGEMGRDQRVVAEMVVTDGADQIWKLGRLPDELELEMFGDQFKIEFSRRTGQATEIRILRLQYMD